MMDEPDRWRQMASAPKDGSRILVTIRPSEQGPAEVDLAYWSSGDRFGSEGGFGSGAGYASARQQPARGPALRGMRSTDLPNRF